jgi:hypothetical protein
LIRLENESKSCAIWWHLFLPLALFRRQTLGYAAGAIDDAMDHIPADIG